MLIWMVLTVHVDALARRLFARVRGLRAVA
jgi:hypothetical protein